MNINYNELPKRKNIFSEIFDFESIFSKFKIEENKSGDYISIQNIKYAVFYVFKKKIKKKELVKLLYNIRKENQKKDFLSKNFSEEENQKTKINSANGNLDYSYNLIEKSEFIGLLEKIISEHKNFLNLKVSDYDIILEFYVNLATEESFKRFNYRKSNDLAVDLEKNIIENDVKITFEVFRKKVSEVFPNIELNLIKSCFDRLDVENQGYIKISALESFFIH